MTFTLRDMAFLAASAGGGGDEDPDAAAYLNAVEVADGQALEADVRAAINDFVVGCKDEGIWDAIKASCILAGARTLDGALVPLVGTAPSDFNFEAGDYNRKTGLTGNGTNKYLASNRNNNDDPRDSKHLAVWLTTHPPRDATKGIIGSPSSTGGSHLVTNTVVRTFRINNSIQSDAVPNESTAIAGLYGASRSSGSSISGRYAGVTNNYSATSRLPLSEAIDIFRRGTDYSDGTMSFYSIGEALNLALLDSRVSALMTALNSAIS